MTFLRSFMILGQRREPEERRWYVSCVRRKCTQMEESHKSALGNIDPSMVTACMRLTSRGMFLRKDLKRRGQMRRCMMNNSRSARSCKARAQQACWRSLKTWARRPFAKPSRRSTFTANHSLPLNFWPEPPEDCSHSASILLNKSP